MAADKTKVATAAAKANDMGTLMRGFQQEVLALEHTKRALAQQFKNEPKKTVMVSPLYQPYFSKVMPVTINGICVCMPIDGTAHSVPESFADEILGRIAAIDSIIKKQRHMADIGDNCESTPGELKIF